MCDVCDVCDGVWPAFFLALASLASIQLKHAVLVIGARIRLNLSVSVEALEITRMLAGVRIAWRSALGHYSW